MKRGKPFVSKQDRIIASALDSVAERVGEPAWFTELRDRLVIALLEDRTPLERLCILGPPVSGETPYDESQRVVNEPKPVACLRCMWERELDPDDIPSGDIPRCPAKTGGALHSWRKRFYASLARDD